MDEKRFYTIRLLATGLVSLSIWLLLLWNHYHGGVPRHHILANKDLPSISNWWGGLLLPLLTWFLLYRIQQRIFRHNNTNSERSKYLTYSLYGFMGAFVFGILLSTFFSLGNSDIPGYLMMGLFPLAFFAPIYRAEYLLGFVIGMTFTFGAVLPTGIGTLLAFIGLVIYRVLRPGIRYISAAIMRLAS